MKNFFDVVANLFGFVVEIFANPHFLERAAERFDSSFTEESMAATKHEIFDMVVKSLSRISGLVEETTIPGSASRDARRGDLFCVLDKYRNLFYYVEVRKGSIEIRTIVRLSPMGIAYASKDVQCCYVVEDDDTTVSSHFPGGNGEFDPPDPRLKESRDTHGVDEKRRKKMQKESFPAR